jgi:hypothetical protein
MPGFCSPIPIAGGAAAAVLAGRANASARRRARAIIRDLVLVNAARAW